MRKLAWTGVVSNSWPPQLAGTLGFVGLAGGEAPLQCPTLLQVKPEPQPVVVQDCPQEDDVVQICPEEQSVSEPHEDTATHAPPVEHFCPDVQSPSDWHWAPQDPLGRHTFPAPQSEACEHSVAPPSPFPPPEREEQATTHHHPRGNRVLRMVGSRLGRAHCTVWAEVVPLTISTL